MISLCADHVLSTHSVLLIFTQYLCDLSGNFPTIDLDIKSYHNCLCHKQCPVKIVSVPHPMWHRNSYLFICLLIYKLINWRAECTFYSSVKKVLILLILNDVLKSSTRLKIALWAHGKLTLYWHNNNAALTCSINSNLYEKISAYINNKDYDVDTFDCNDVTMCDLHSRGRN